MKPKNYQLFGQHYQLVKKLGQGSYGMVYKVRNIRQQKYYASKHIDVGRGERIQKFLKEIEFQTLLAHPLVIEIFEYFVTVQRSISSIPRIEIVMELGEKSLYDAILNQNTYFDSENILRFAYNFTKLFAKFQSQQIVHRDIKPENFILFYSNTLDEYKEEKLEAKITDFGLCTNVIQGQLLEVAGTFYYQSPIMKKRFQNSERHRNSRIPSNPYKDDVYSWGLTLYEVVTRKIKQSIIRNVYQDILKRTNLAELAYIIDLMLQENQMKRPDFLQVTKLLYERLPQCQKYEEEEEQTLYSNANSKMSLDLSSSRKSVMSVEYDAQCKNENEDLLSNRRAQQVQMGLNFENSKQKPSQFNLDFHENQQRNRNGFKSQRSNRSINQQSRRIPCYQQAEYLEQQLSENIKPFESSVNNKTFKLLEQPPKPVYNSLTIELGSNVDIRCIEKIKEYIFLGCSDGQIYMVQWAYNQQVGPRFYQIVMPLIEGPQKRPNNQLKDKKHSQHKQINTMTKDKKGNLWVTDSTGRVFVLNRIKLLQALQNQVNYTEELNTKVSFTGRDISSTVFKFKMPQGVISLIEIPFINNKRGISYTLCKDTENYIFGFQNGYIYGLWQGQQCYYQGHIETVTHIKVKGNKVYSSGIDGSIKIWDLYAEGLESRYLQCGQSVSSFEVTFIANKPIFSIITTEGSLLSSQFQRLSNSYVLKTISPNRKLHENFCSIIDEDKQIILGVDGSVIRDGQLISNHSEYGWNCMALYGDGQIVAGGFEGKLKIITWN